MTLQELKQAIIKDETEFIIDLHTDAGSTLAEVNKVIEDMTSFINSCLSLEELVCFYIDQGYSEREAHSNLLHYLIES